MKGISVFGFCLYFIFEAVFVVDEGSRWSRAFKVFNCIFLLLANLFLVYQAVRRRFDTETKLLWYLTTSKCLLLFLVFCRRAPTGQHACLRPEQAQDWYLQALHYGNCQKTSLAVTRIYVLLGVRAAIDAIVKKFLRIRVDVH